MRLYAYEDRFGDPRFGVLARGGLLTGAQLEKRGGLGSRAGPSTRTWTSATTSGTSTTGSGSWRPRPAKALKAGAGVLPPDRRRPLADAS